MGQGGAQTTSQAPERPAGERLEGWKEVAAYLKRDVRTVQRWEKREALPVYRHHHHKLGTVYAYKPELEAWWNNGRARLELREEALAPAGRRWPWVVAAATVLAVGAGVAIWRYGGNFPGRRTAGPTDSSGLVIRRVWTGHNLGINGRPSPDGQYLSYTDWARGDFALRELATGKKRLLTHNQPWIGRGGYAGASIISPDGKQVAYAWFNDSFYDLRIVPIKDASADNTPGTVYSDPRTFYLAPHDWSPDSKQILVTLARTKDGTHQIGLVSVHDGSLRVLKNLDWRTAGRMAFSPDGRFIAYDFPPREDAPQRDLFLLSTDGSREMPLVQHPADDFLLGWAPQASSILFASDRAGTTDLWAMEIQDGKPQGAPALIKKNLGQIVPIGFAGKAAFYYGLWTGVGDVYTAAMDVAQGTVLSPAEPASHSFAGSKFSPDWSPDGQHLAYVTQRAGVPNSPGSRVIVVRSFKTGGERRVVPKLNTVEELRWSPDGRHFLVYGNDTRDRQGLYQVDSLTGQTSNVLRPSNQREVLAQAAWAPDGKRIFYKRKHWTVEPSPLLVHDLRTGRGKELLPAVYHFAVSPDGERVAFSAGGQRPRSVLKVVPVGGGESGVLYRGRITELCAWTPDGRYLLFTKTETNAQGWQTALWRISAEGGEPKRVGVAMEALREVRVHPDGRRIAFTAGEWKGEVWVMENFLPSRRTAP